MKTQTNLIILTDWVTMAPCGITKTLIKGILHGVIAVDPLGLTRDGERKEEALKYLQHDLPA